MRKVIIAILFVVALFQSSAVMAQDLLRSNDLSTIKVDYLSDSDIVKIKTQLQANNVTIEQAEPMALSKGMSAVEFGKLKARLAQFETKKEPSQDGTKNGESGSAGKSMQKQSGRTQQEIINIKVKDSLKSLVFGSELFENPTLNFGPNLKLATSINYVSGPGDELQVSVY